MANKIILRRDTSVNWTNADPVLSNGEIGLETDTGEFKIGNGVSPWSVLPAYKRANEIAAEYNGALVAAVADAVDQVLLAEEQVALAAAQVVLAANQVTAAQTARTEAQGFRNEALSFRNTANNAQASATASAQEAANYVSYATDAAIEMVLTDEESVSRQVLDEIYLPEEVTNFVFAMKPDLPLPMTEWKGFGYGSSSIWVHGSDTNVDPGGSTLTQNGGGNGARPPWLSTVRVTDSLENPKGSFGLTTGVYSIRLAARLHQIENASIWAYPARISIGWGLGGLRNWRTSIINQAEASFTLGAYQPEISETFTVNVEFNQVIYPMIRVQGTGEFASGTNLLNTFVDITRLG